MAANLEMLKSANEIAMNAMSAGEMIFRTSVGYFD